MGLVKEPKNVDFSMKSEPWTDQELSDFRKIMKTIKDSNAIRKQPAAQTKVRKKQPA